MKKIELAEFSLAEMISIVSKKSIVNILDMNDCLCFLFQDGVSAFEMLDAMEIARPYILKKYTKLKDFETFQMLYSDGNNIKKCKEEIDQFLSNKEKIYGKRFILRPLPEKERLKLLNLEDENK